MRRSLTRAAVCCITPVPVASPWTIEKSLYSGSVLRARLSPLLSSSTSGRWETVGFSILHSHLLSARPQHKARAGKALESAGWAQCVGPGMCSFHWRVLETPPPRACGHLPTVRAACGCVRQDCRGPSSGACSPVHLDESLRAAGEQKP